MTELAICSFCGKQHPVAEIELSFKRPDDYLLVPLEDRELRTRSTNDQCAIWGDDDSSHRYFVRGLLLLPVAEWPESYSLGVWLEVSRASFERINELWDELDQADEPPFEAMLANAVPFHASTCRLTGRLYLTGPSTRPEFHLNSNENSLFVEQTQGIAAHRAIEYAEFAAKPALQPTRSARLN